MVQPSSAVAVVESISTSAGPKQASTQKILSVSGSLQKKAQTDFLVLLADTKTRQVESPVQNCARFRTEQTGEPLPSLLVPLGGECARAGRIVCVGDLQRQL